MPNKIAKSRRMDCERASQHFAHEIMDCINSVRAVRTMYQRQDLFGCDTVGKRIDGSHVYIQATAGQDQAVTARKRKLEKYPWHKSDIVLIVQLKSQQDPENKRRKLWSFKVWELIEVGTGMQWEKWDKQVYFKSGWFRAFKADAPAD